MVQRRLDSGRLPSALLVMCVTDRGLQRVAQHAAQAGVHVLFLNASEDNLESVRAANPGVAVGIVCPDEIETGRIQGRQFRRLLPHGGRVLYVQGRIRSEAARDRTAGVLAAIEGTPIDLIQLEAGWTAEDGREAAGVWLRMALRVKRNLDLIGCQNDMIAQGVLQAMSSVSAELGRPEIRSIPVTGCDGSPDMGQAMVRRGELRATVVLPRATGPAVEAIARVLRGGELPAPVTLLKPTSFPEELEPGASAGSARTSVPAAPHLWPR
jgi:ABC-type sugar transport system substrate-binding protein